MHAAQHALGRARQAVLDEGVGVDTDRARNIGVERTGEESALVDMRRRLVENGIFPVCRRCCKVELSPEPVAEPFGAGVTAPPRRAIPLTVVR